MTRFICTGDLHLGQRPDLAENRLADQRQVWEEVLLLARDQAAAVLFAGDAFEGPLATPEQLEAFIEPIELIGVPVYAITGNGRHDSAMREATALDALRYVPNLWVASREEAIFDFDGIRIAAMPWTSAKNGLVNIEFHGEHRHEYLAQVIVSAAASMQPEADVLLTHFSMTGAQLPNGLPVEQLREVVVDYDALEAQGWQAIVCGHIHQPQVLGTRGFYVGSPLPLNFGEADTQHGCWILDVEPGQPTGFRFHELESRQVAIFDWNEGIELAGAMGAVIRVDYIATEEQARAIDQAQIRQNLLDQGAHRVFFKPTIIRTDRVRVQEMVETLSDGEALGIWLESQSLTPDTAGRVITLHRELQEETC